MQQKNAFGSGQKKPTDADSLKSECSTRRGAREMQHLMQYHDQRSAWLDNQTLMVRVAAKINLTLSVGPKRPDGFHAFESLMATVSLYDDLLLRPSRSGITLTCDEPQIPTDIDNLVYRAALMLAETSNIEPDVNIELAKRIPTQAGLGGGSADAAAALIGLNKLWDLELPKGDLMNLAANLGSDVGFFLNGPLAICTGRGEIVKPIDLQWEFWGVIIKPKLSLSTAAVYKGFEPEAGKPFERADALVEKLAKLKPSQISAELENDLEASAFTISGELGELRSSLEKLINVPVRLSGSGSALFALFDTCNEAESALNRIEESLGGELTCWLVRNNAW